MRPCFGRSVGGGWDFLGAVVLFLPVGGGRWPARCMAAGLLLPQFPCAVFVFRRDMGLFGPSFSGASPLSSGAAVPPARRPPSSFASSVSSPALASSVPEQLVTNSNAKSRKDSALQFCPVQFRHTRTLQIVKSTWLAAKWQRANAGQSP